MPSTSTPYGFSLFKSKTSNPSFGSAEFPIPSGYTVATATSTASNGPVLAGIGEGDPVGWIFASNAGLSTGNVGLIAAPYGATLSSFTTATNGNSIPYTSKQPLVGIFGGCSFSSNVAGQYPTPKPFLLNGQQTAGTPASSISATIQDEQWHVWKVQTNGAFLTAYTTYPATPIGLNFNFLYNQGVNPSSGQSTAQLFVFNSLATNSTGQLGLTVPTSNSGNNLGFFKVVGLAPAQFGQTNNWTDPYVDVLVTINNHYLSAGTVAGNN